MDRTSCFEVNRVRGKQIVEENYTVCGFKRRKNQKKKGYNQLMLFNFPLRILELLMVLCVTVPYFFKV